MESQYHFRQAETSDLDLVTRWTLALIEHEALDSDLEIPLKTDVKQRIHQWLENLLKSDSALLILAQSTDNQCHGCILGLVQMSPNDFIDLTIYGLIQMVWVEPEYRRTGLAKQLLTHMEQTFRNLDVPYCEISYSDSNKEAQAFWQSNGYQAVSHTCRKNLI